MNRALLLLLAIILKSSLTTAQCDNRITHTSGEEIINNVTITVSSWGFVEDFEADDACDYTLDYTIGREMTSMSGSGSYTFQFSPPVNSVSLNFFRLDKYADITEEIQLFLNDEHYPIPSPGTVIDCPSDDDLAVLTSEGNIQANPVTHRGAWEGPTIEGTIETITVLNNVIEGNPNGALFSIHFCEPILGLDDYNPDQLIYMYPNPFKEQLTIQLPETLTNPSATLYNINGQLLRKLSLRQPGSLILDRGDLAPGMYFLEVTEKGRSYVTKKVVVTD